MLLLKQGKCQIILYKWLAVLDSWPLSFFVMCEAYSELLIAYAFGSEAEGISEADVQKLLCLHKVLGWVPGHHIKH